MELIDLITVRELQPTDLNFILSSSIKTLQSYSKKLYPAIGTRELYDHLEQIILGFFGHKDFSILVACDAKDSDHVIGYLMVNQALNHIFLQYTKYAFRHLGVQKIILMPLLVDFTKPITYEFATKETIKLYKLFGSLVKSKCMEQLIQFYLENKK